MAVEVHMGKGQRVAGVKSFRYRYHGSRKLQSVNGLFSTLTINEIEGIVNCKI